MCPMNGALAREVGGSLYVPTDCMDEDAIAKAVKVAAGLGPLRAAGDDRRSVGEVHKSS